MSKTPKRPRDMMQLAKMVGELATGDSSEDVMPAPSPSSVKWGPRERRSCHLLAGRLSSQTLRTRD